MPYVPIPGMHELGVYSPWLKGKGLNAGAGGKELPRTMALDMDPTASPDVVWNFGDVPWPFTDRQFDFVLFEHSIEHVCNWIAVLTEALRVADHAVVLLWDSLAAPFSGHCIQWQLPTTLRLMHDFGFSVAESGVINDEEFYVVVQRS